MSCSVVGTCSHCQTKAFWLSDTLALQLDDGSLVCLRHPAEGYDCEQHGLTLVQASKRGRLFREKWFVCRHCGQDGTVIQRQAKEEPLVFTIRGTMRWCWTGAAILIPLGLWLGWTGGLFWPLGFTLLIAPAISWHENRKIAKANASRGLPLRNAPGESSIGPPTLGCRPRSIVGRVEKSDGGECRATGPCCDSPDWVEADRVTDQDNVPCCECGIGRMTVSEWSIH